MLKIKRDAVVEKRATRRCRKSECKRCSVDAHSSWSTGDAPTQLAAKGMRAEGVNSGREAGELTAADDDGDGDENDVAA
jgi:hypothetical protein